METPMLEKVYRNFYNVWFLWSLCFVLNIITLLFIVYKIHPGAGTLALRYNVLVGVEWYGKGKNLYYLPGIAFLLTLANYTLYRSLKNSRIFLAPLTIFVSICLQVTFLLAVLFLSRIN